VAGKGRAEALIFIPGRRAVARRPVLNLFGGKIMDSPGSRRRRLVAILCATPFLVVVGLFEIVPLLAVAVNGVKVDGELSLGNFVEIFSSVFQRNAFLTSLLV
jgi:hypothetical protein